MSKQIPVEQLLGDAANLLDDVENLSFQNGVVTLVAVVLGKRDQSEKVRELILAVGALNKANAALGVQ